MVKLYEPPSELIEVMDRQNRPLAVLRREQVHRQRLMHRAVLVLVFDQANKLILQRRSRNKSLYPGLWDVSASGHVLSGESRDEAAQRELWEELGLSAKRIQLRYELPGTVDTGYEFVSLFSAGRTGLELRPNPLEVEDVYAVDQEELDSMMIHFPDQHTPGLHYFWQRNLLFAPRQAR